MKNFALLFLSLFIAGTSSHACELSDGTKGEVISAVVGDWSGDGHEKTETIVFCSNLGPKEINNTYKAGAKVIGFDLIDDVAVDYEDNILRKEHSDQLLVSGFDLSSFESGDKDGEFYLYKEDFFKIWIYFLKLGDANFKFSTINTFEVTIGGYGFFY